MLISKDIAVNGLCKAAAGKQYQSPSAVRNAPVIVQPQHAPGTTGKEKTAATNKC